MSDHFVNCDWGTSHFRLRLIDRATVTILGEYGSEEGTARLAAASTAATRADRFGVTLRRGLGELAAQVDRPLDRLPIVISGMASSSIGWREVPYASLPFALDGRDLAWQDAGPLGDGFPGAIYLLSGVRSNRDVMRGEETEAVGIHGLPGMAGLLDAAVVILPGTHAKHLQVVEGRIVDFQTYMTGELFDLLSRHSSLQHSTSPRGEKAGQGLSLADPLVEPFCEGVDEGTHRPLPTALFQVRTRQLLRGCDAASNTAYLSGLLIGAELAALRDRSPEAAPIVLAAGRRLCEPYRTALHVLGLGDRLTVVAPADVDRLSALGQAALLERLEASAHCGRITSAKR